jgi:hypothetical protein
VVRNIFLLTVPSCVVSFLLLELTATPLANGIGARGIRVLGRLFPRSRYVRKACGLIEFLSARGSLDTRSGWPLMPGAGGSPISGVGSMDLGLTKRAPPGF